MFLGHVIMIYFIFGQPMTNYVVFTDVEKIGI